MFCTFIVVDNNVSEMRFWKTIESAEIEFDYQCKLTTEQFGYKFKLAVPRDFEIGQMRKYIFEGENNTECIVYLYDAS